jgi:hypothetical protein
LNSPSRSSVPEQARQILAAFKHIAARRASSFYDETGFSCAQGLESGLADEPHTKQKGSPHIAEAGTLQVLMKNRYNSGGWISHLQFRVGSLFKPGEKVPYTGIYRVDHDRHRLMHMATLLATDRFPQCKQCGSLVRFTLARIVRKAIPFRSTVHLEPVPGKKSPTRISRTR